MDEPIKKVKRGEETYVYTGPIDNLADIAQKAMELLEPKYHRLGTFKQELLNGEEFRPMGGVFAIHLEHKYRPTRPESTLYIQNRNAAGDAHYNQILKDITDKLEGIPMTSKLASALDNIANSLEAKGLIKEAYELDKVADLLEEHTNPLEQQLDTPVLNLTHQNLENNRIPSKLNVLKKNIIENVDDSDILKQNYLQIKDMIREFFQNPVFGGNPVPGMLGRKLRTLVPNLVKFTDGVGELSGTTAKDKALKAIDADIALQGKA
jgi:hypothetical protein